MTKDYNRAFELFEKGCDGGNARGCGLMGWLYTKGLGVSKDSAKGKVLLQKGCSMGDRVSCDELEKIK